FSSRRRHTRFSRDWSSDVCSSDLAGLLALYGVGALVITAIAALSLVLEVWLAALVVTLVLLAASGVAALVGKRKVDEALPPAPEHTIASVKKDIAAVTGEDR